MEASARDVHLIYFAWVRERVGLSDERLSLPASVRTAGEMIAWLAERGDNYAYALESPSTIRVAVDQLHIEQDEPLGDAREIALFPPMTGG
ncbi:molybdopterin converting factor subunit 1 [Pleomorphomonas diazotrophica]|uniref:Molybdopterin converting factor subunit 1 n=1 Tax=Pleomorphomonas diazotrophica TaxID=1166257 RepID=A0A1I4U687_9HYPH|nr:molybdopterin converting factor subunit 1 [Pleomorphomonas diazotrophica]PKR91173.1 molybdopterin converting factor subunit 1 [Pleomorphomonas diazotrophica]SFM84331.1 molybdopterin synthase subunit MoaD [Pleomorphomonas diazotrophica]